MLHILTPGLTMIQHQKTQTNPDYMLLRETPRRHKTKQSNTMIRPMTASGTLSKFRENPSNKEKANQKRPKTASVFRSRRSTKSNPSAKSVGKSPAQKTRSGRVLRSKSASFQDVAHQQTTCSAFVVNKSVQEIVCSEQAKNEGSATALPCHRKVAWEATEDTTCCVDNHGFVEESKVINEDKTTVDTANDVVVNHDTEDSYRLPDFSILDNCDEYETDLEDNAPAKTKDFDSSGKRMYLRLCKREGVLAATGLSNQFTNKHMVIKHRCLGSKGVLPLAKALVKNVYVEKLDLSDNFIEADGAMLISNMLFDNCYITELNLSQNFIGADGGIAIAGTLITNQSLRKIILSANRLTDRVSKNFAEALKENRTLQYLDLSHNEFGENGAIVLGTGLALNYGLKYLDLSWNCIRGKGGVAIAQALKTNDSLTTLKLSWNGLSLLGCVALGRHLRRNENLKELDLTNNRIGYLGAQRISPGLTKNSSLEILKVGLNPISGEGIESLLKAVKNNKSLKLVTLEDVTVSENVYQQIQDLEKVREIRIITGGVGNFKQPKPMPRQMAVLLDFIKVNRLRLVDWFFQFDKDHSGDISKDEFKNGLKETGLKMTQRQLDALMEYLDVDNDGKIDFNELLIGREHTLKEQRDFRMAQQKLYNMENMRARLPKLREFEISS